METPIKVDDLGVPLFSETSKLFFKPRNDSMEEEGGPVEDEFGNIIRYYRGEQNPSAHLRGRYTKRGAVKYDHTISKPDQKQKVSKC